MSRRYVVYALADPRDGSLRYIGRTMNLKTRVAGHVPHRGENMKKRAWLADLLAVGLSPKVIVLRRCRTVLAAAAAEDELTEKARAEGQPLTNGSGKRGHCGATGVRSRFGLTYVSIRNLKAG